MPDIVRAIMESGRVQFIRERKPESETTRTYGNVTIHIRHSHAAIPAHFQVSFNITVDHEEQGLAIQHVFELSQIVLNQNDAAPYREVEAQGARQLAPMLRGVADQIEKAVAEFDERAKPAD